MRVALVIDDRIDRPGGIQEYLLGLYDFLKAQKHTPVIFTIGRYSKKAKADRKIISLGKPIEFLGNDAQKAFLLPFGQKEKIKKILEREKPEIVHIQGFPGILSLNFLRYSHSTNVMTYHVYGESTLNDILGKVFLSFWKEVNKNLHGKIAISEVAASSAKKFIPGPYEIIPIGIDLNRFQKNVPKISRFKDEKINILFVGRLDKRKGLNYLLAAFKRLNQQEVRLIIVGDGPERKKAQTYVRRNKLKNVVFVGKVSRLKLPCYFATADIFCSPATHGESFGVVLIEAMAAGLPVVAFDNPGYRSIFPDFARAFLIPSRNISALTQSLFILATNKNLRQELGFQNRCFVRKYSWERVGSETLNFYQELLGQFPVRAQL